MDTPILSSPTKILNPISPERMNQQFVPSSPSRASDLQQRKKTRGMSDVQARVAFLNNLSRGDSPANASQPSTSASASAALQRAILGREEAESTLASVSDQLTEAQIRERRISERLEALLEELQSAKERQAHERSVFEKEIRKARKEAFRAGSALVKLQEDLKHARMEAKALKEEAQSEREAKEQAKQEAFERAYALAGLTEELEVLKGRLRNVETNNHSNNLEAQAKEIHSEVIGRLSLAEGDLAFLTTPTPRRPKRPAEDARISPFVKSTDQSPTQETPPKRVRLSDVTPRQGGHETTPASSHHEMIDELEEALKQEKKFRLDAEDMIEFLRMECEFKRCSCRLAEEEEEAMHVHVSRLANVKVEDEYEPIMEPEHQDSHGFQLQEPNQTDLPFSPLSESRHTNNQTADQQPEELLITFSPVTGTFKSVPSPARSPAKHPQNKSLNTHQLLGSPLGAQRFDPQRSPFESIMELEDPIRPFAQGLEPSPAHNQVPWDSPLPRYSMEDAQTTPRESDGYLAPHSVPLPGTSIDREQALAQIRARRGRTNTMKRSVSANEASLLSTGTGTTPARGAHRIPGVQNSAMRSDRDKGPRRDMSAPVKMFHQ